MGESMYGLAQCPSEGSILLHHGEDEVISTVAEYYQESRQAIVESRLQGTLSSAHIFGIAKHYKFQIKYKCYLYLIIKQLNWFQHKNG